MSQVLVRYFAAARHVVGIAQETLDGSGGLTQIVSELSQRSDEVRAVVSRCTFLVDRRRISPTDEPLADGVTVDVLPPFAGG